MKQRELNRLLKFWQKRLRLQDWNIRIEVCAKQHLSSKNRDTELMFESYDKSAIIQMLNEKEFSGNDPYNIGNTIKNVDEGQEHALLHELVHLHLIDWQPNENYVRSEERACNMIAWALLEGSK